MKVLITGFDPFGGESVNPAFEAVKKVPDVVAGAEVIKLEVPTVFGKAGAKLEKALAELQPDIAICVGQAGGRSAMTVEKVAINLVEARIPDNEGNQPFGVPVREDGDTAYFSTLPVKAMAAAMQEKGIPAFVSYTAGTYVCNELMYHLLYLTSRKFPSVKGCFIHVPYATEQAVGKPNGTASMSLDDIAKALTAGVEAAVKGEEIEAAGGTTH